MEVFSVVKTFELFVHWRRLKFPFSKLRLRMLWFVKIIGEINCCSNRGDCC